MKATYIIGFFGYSDNQLDGQTVKTRNIYDLLVLKGINAKCFDTQKLRYSKLSIFQMLFNVLFYKNIIIVPAGNSLKWIYPIVFFLSKIFSKNLTYILIGGWLCWYISDKPFLRWMVRHTSFVLPETFDVVNGLREEYGMNNVEYFPNFRISNYVPTFNENNGKLKIVFCARIHRMKGLDVVFYIAEKLSQMCLLDDIIIDFYGQINEDDRDYFISNVQHYDFVQYKGFLEPDEINITLCKYDVMLFPTRYINDEGFPGSILDAYMSGIPVIASNWCHSKEFVSDGYSGFICNINNLDEFVDKVFLFYQDRNLLLKMKRNAYEESKKYSDVAAYTTLNKIMK